MLLYTYYVYRYKCVRVCVGTPATVNIIGATNNVSSHPSENRCVREERTVERTDGTAIKKNQLVYGEKSRRRVTNKRFNVLKCYVTFSEVFCKK